MRIYINENADATNSQVASLQNSNEARLPELYIGDIIELQITFGNGQGGYSTFQGRADIVLNSGIGVAKDRLPYTVTQTMEKLSDYYFARLNLSTEELKNAIGDEEEIELDFEIQLSNANDMTRTLLQKKILLRNQLIQAQSIPLAPDNLLAIKT